MHYQPFLTDLSAKDRHTYLLHQAELERLYRSSRAARAGRFARLLLPMGRLFIIVGQWLQKKGEMKMAAGVPSATR